MRLILRPRARTMELGACWAEGVGSGAGMPGAPASAGGTSSAREAGVGFGIRAEVRGVVAGYGVKDGTEATTGAVVGWRVARTWPGWSLSLGTSVRAVPFSESGVGSGGAGVAVRVGDEVRVVRVAVSGAVVGGCVAVAIRRSGCGLGLPCTSMMRRGGFCRKKAE
jgi:hypothetical protein